MARSANVTKQEIVSTALSLARQGGAAALGIRKVASACGVSVGTIYNHFPDKSALVIEVTAAYWQEALDPWLSRPRGLGLADSCLLLARSLSEPLAKFQATWLKGIESLASTARTEGKQEEHALVASVLRSLEHEAEHDPAISPTSLEALGSHELALFCWCSILGAIRSGMDTSETLAALLTMALGGRPQRTTASCQRTSWCAPRRC